MTSHCLIQWWPKLIMPHGITWPQWVDDVFWQPLLLFVVDGGMSLLKNPSAAMAKLIQSAEKSVGKPGGAERALVRPVMAFVTERHDLEGLQLAMRQALRKAACRVFALQVNTDTKPWDQFHNRVSCSCENKRFPYLNNNEKIRSQFCTYHDSFIVICAELWPEIKIRIISWNFNYEPINWLMVWSTCLKYVNSLWPSDAILKHRSGSTLAPVMAYCLTAPSHYLNQL